MAFWPSIVFFAPNYAADFPDTYVSLEEEECERRTLIGSDQCIIDNEMYFIRGLVELRIIGFQEPFLWGLWASIWKEAFDEISEHWQTPGREKLIWSIQGAS